MDITIIKGGINKLPKNTDMYSSGVCNKYKHSIGYDKMIKHLIYISKKGIEQNNIFGVSINWDEEIEITNKYVYHKPHSKYDYACIIFRLKTMP